MEKRVPNLYLENAEILPGAFRNFAGRGDRYNKEGNRNFTVVIPDEKTAKSLIRDGWNVRELPSRDEGEEIRWKLNVTVSFRELRGLPPTTIYMYSGKSRTRLTETTVDALDYANYRTADLTVRPRFWTDDKTGERKIKAYLQEMRVIVEPDRWADKYRDYDAEEETDDGEDLPF